MGIGCHVWDVSVESLPAQFGSRWYTLWQSGQLVRLWRGSDAAQKQKPYTLESIHPTCLLSIVADTHQVCLFFFFFFYRQPLWLGFVSCLFYGIVMAKCIFFMSWIAGGAVPVGQWRCLFFLMCMSFGTASYNDFLLPLFKSCLQLDGFSA